jgi:hypothetical protein
MVLDEITDMLTKRKAELVDMLENRSDGVALEKQHQIYGAINEIDLFLQTITYHQQNDTEKDIGPVNLLKPDEDRGFFGNIFAGMKGKVKTNK